MIPRLFDSTATEFNTNGIGVLVGTISCSVRQVLNGEYELQLSYPINGPRVSDLVERAIIVAKPDPISDDQAFRIYRVTKGLGNWINVYSEHISYDLSGVPVSPFSAEDVGTAFSNLKQHTVVDTPFEFVTDKTTTAPMSLKIPYSARNVLGGVEGSILDVYRGEFEWDNFTVRLWNRRGEDRGVHIRYGKNLTSFEQDSNCANMYTAVYPYWNIEEEVVIGNLITVIEGANYTRILSLDLSERFEEKPSVEQLDQQAQAYISANKLNEPSISWNISFQSLEKSIEYPGKTLLEGVYLGDTVHVDFDKLGISVNSRAVETDYDPILERYNNITLGSVKTTLSDTVSYQEKAIQKTPTKSLIESISRGIAKQISGIHGGCIRILDTNGDGEPDELYIADDPDPLKALKVWRFNYQGWGASSTGYNGPFVMGATLEDGLLADFVTAANLTAGIIQSKDKKSFYLNLDTGVLNMDAKSIALNGNQLGDFITVTYDSDGKPVISLGWSGNNIRLNLLNDRINFSGPDGQELAYWTTDSFRLKTLQSFQLGNMKMVAQESGSVSFIKGDA